MIVENAIRIIAPLPNHASATAFAVQLEPNSELQTMSDRGDILSRVLELADFERFAFVMSVLERYPDQDCSVLMGCTPREISDARRRALQQIAQSYAENAVTSRAR